MRARLPALPIYARSSGRAPERSKTSVQGRMAAPVSTQVKQRPAGRVRRWGTALLPLRTGPDDDGVTCLGHSHTGRKVLLTPPTGAAAEGERSHPGFPAGR